MLASNERTLGVALRSTGLAMALFVGEEIVTARVSAVAAKAGYGKTKEVLGNWLTRYQPDLVVIEDYRTAARKGPRQRRALRHLPAFARRFPCEVMVIERRKTHANLYIEASALAIRFPSLEDRVPRKPELWEREPHFVSMFEAVTLAVNVLDDPDRLTRKIEDALS